MAKQKAETAVKHPDGLIWDCLDDPTPAEVEKAYRRGFMQGAAFASCAYHNGATYRQVEGWIYGKLHNWRYASRKWRHGDVVRPISPPDPPHLTRRTQHAG